MGYMKKNLIGSVITLVIGVGLLIVWLLGYIKNSSLFGLGCGFSAVGLFNTVQSILILRNPKRCKEVEILKNEERNIFLRQKTNSTVYSIFIYIECAIVILSLILGYNQIAMILSFIMCGKIVVWSIIATINIKNC